jgi:RNA polymerase sigma-70 factor (ECF subfamily)
MTSCFTQNRRLFEEFIGRHRQHLLRLARNLCRKGGVDPEDLVQDTLERAFREWGPLREKSDPRRLAWLSLTLQRRFFDHHRRQRTEAQEGPILEVVRAPVVVREPRTWQSWEHLSEEDLNRAVNRLKPSLRTAFELHAAGLRYKAIAQRLGTTPGTVGFWLHEARRELKTQLMPLAQARDTVRSAGRKPG